MRLDEITEGEHRYKRKGSKDWPQGHPIIGGHGDEREVAEETKLGQLKILKDWMSMVCQVWNEENV